MIHRYIHIIICLIFAYDANAQEYTITKYDVSDGLPQTQTIEIMQDSKGFLWIMTKNGISKYDGKEFKNYGVEDGLPNNQCRGIYESENGVIRVVGENGISEYDGKRFTLTLLPEEFKNRIYYNRYNTSSNGIFIISVNNDTVQLIKYENRSFEIYTSFIIEGLNRKPTKYWICNDNQSVLLEQNDTIYRLSKPIHKKSYVNPVFNGLNISVIQHNTKTYFITDTSFHHYTEQSIVKMDTPTIIKDEIISPFHRHYKIGSSLNLYNDKHISKLIWDSELISSTLLDKDSVLWVSTEGGLYKLETTAFLNLFPRHGLIKNVWSIVEGNNGEMYFASLGEGVQKYENGSFSRVKAFETYNETNYTHGSTRLSDGTMLFTGYHEILKYDGKALTKLPWADTQVECIYENTILNEIVFGSFNGAKRIKGNKQNILYKSGKEKYPYIRSISYHPDGYYWLGSDHGIARHDDENNRFYSSDSIKIKTPLSSDIDSSGNAWFGGLEGLFYYDEKTDDFTPALPEAENEVVKFLKVMDKDRILIGRLKDLLILNIHKYFANEENAIQTLNQVDGYLGIEPKQNGVRKDSKGMYWIYCSNGVIRFDPDKLRTNPKPPDLYYTNLWVRSDTSEWTRYASINNYDTVQIENIQLSHIQNNIKINFTAISTFKEEKIQYRYKLSGGRESWSIPQSNNFIEFHQLKPGKYNLELIASNGDGVWTPNPAIVNFYIKPAFWQTTIFRVTAIMLFIVLIVIITTSINRRIAIRKERQKAIVSDFNTMQMNQLIKQFDPHFTFNIISSIGALILSKDTEKAYKYFTMLSRLLRSVLAKHTVFTRTLKEELELLEDYCSIQQYQLKDRFEYEMQVSDDVDTNFKIPKMLIQNFVENAIKHGINPKPGGGKIWITIMKNGNILNIFIRDNGVGRKASSMHEITGTKSGTRITEQLFRLIEKQTGKKVKYDIIDLYDENKNPTGTEVVLGFPVDLQL